MQTHLGRILDNNTWANQGLLDFLRDQPPETLDLTAAGVYGSSRETLEHLFSSELSHHWRLIGRKREELPEGLEHPDPAALKAMEDRRPRGSPGSSPPGRNSTR